MKYVKLLLICLIAVGLLCSGCKKEGSPAEEPNTAAASSTISDIIPKPEMTWVLCSNEICKAKYQIGLKEYFKYIEANANPMGPAPALTCKKCDEPSVYKAEKCQNPACGIVFPSGSVPNDFADRCPECKRSETEEIRK
ncbi:MAG: hypothetical protein GY774_07045 [Planctomycetes bacterium]|nr:hypothetical protein [Planctomycetota bacterium]